MITPEALQAMIRSLQEEIELLRKANRATESRALAAEEVNRSKDSQIAALKKLVFEQEEKLRTR